MHTRVTLGALAMLIGCGGSTAPASTESPHTEPTTATQAHTGPVLGDGMLTLDALHPIDEATEAAMERARAYQPHAALRFEVQGAPRIDAGRLMLTGVLTNDDAEPHEVIVFPAGDGGFYAEFAPGSGIPRRPPPPGMPPMPPPVPPPPRRFEMPAHARVRLVAVLILADYVLPAGASVDVDWTFQYWNEPRPHGVVRVTLP